MKKFLQCAADCGAQEIAELAIVMPILLMLIFGIFSFARAYNVYSTITRAAQEGARVATASLCVTCASVNVPASCSVATPAGQFPPDECVGQAIKDTITASHLDSGQITQVVPSSLVDCPNPPAHTCTTPQIPSTSSTISICRNVALNTNTNAALQTCGTVVSFQYSYQFIPVPFLTLNTINIPARAQVRVEN
jgi:hypothetical protein